MPELQITPLPETLRPLLDKFYRAHRSPMRSSSEACLWVARQGDIIGGLCLTAVGQGYWLTGLFVAPQWRGQKVAARLVEQAVESLDGPVWLFCHPDLQGFYKGLGFTPNPTLPPTLQERLARYSRSKPLVALGR